MDNHQQLNLITKIIDQVEFQLQEDHDFHWLESLGTIFSVFDQQDSGNISFGVERDGHKYFVKYAGARPINFRGNPKDAIWRLKMAVPVFQALEHPHLVKFVDSFSTENGYALAFEWFEGECLHSHGAAKYTNPASPYYRFKKLDIEKRLKAIDAILSFHTYVESQNYVAIDFYDGSILYDFKNDEIKICDIDYYQKSSFINGVGNLWGSKRFKSPEEYTLGSPIDSITNVFNMGAMVFVLLGGELDRNISKWDASQGLYEVALKAVEEERHKRYTTVKEFYEAWKCVLAK